MEAFPKGSFMLYLQKYVFSVPSNTAKFPVKVTLSGAEKKLKFIIFT